jgi:hypothetical protein
VARRCADPVDVERQADVPARFRWRDRDYAVRAVLAHWVETGAWWRTATLDDAEREFWRVETGPSAGGVFDLCFDWSAGVWSLVRVHD